MEFYERIEVYLKEMPHVEVTDDNFFDFERELDKKWIDKIVDLYSGKEIKDKKGNKLKISSSSKADMTSIFWEINF